MKCFHLKDKVLVLFKESNNQFSGVIDCVRPDNFYDVLFDDLVNGQKVLEKNISADRIESGDDYFFESEIVSDENSFDHFKEVTPESYFKGTTVEELLKLESNADVDNTELSLLNVECVELLDSLSNTLINAMFEANPTKLDTISVLLSEHFNNNEEGGKSVVVDGSADGVDTVAKCNEWLNSQKTVDDSALNTTLGVISSTAALLRILSVFSSSVQYSRTSRLGSAVSDELLERAVHFVNAFVTSNILATTKIKDDIGTGGAVAGKKGKGGKNSADVLQRKLVVDSCKVVLPVVVSFVQSLENLLLSSKQPDRVSISAFELAFTLLRIDPATNLVAEGLATASNNLLLGLHKAAVSLLRVVFVGYPSHRQSILIENLSLLSHVYSAKSPSKLFPLHCNAHTLGEIGRLATTASIALLSCLQSVINVSAGLTAVLPREEETDRTDGNDLLLPGDSPKDKKAKKGGKGAKSKNAAAADSTDDAAVTTAAAVPAKASRPGDLSSYALKECQRCCVMFANELLKRCAHREASSEYRNAANCLMSELFSTVVHPTWPITAVLIDQLAKRLATQLNTSSVAIDVKGEKRDNAFVVFLLDLLGSLSLNLRRVVLVVEKEVDCANNKQLAPVVREAVRAKLDKLKMDWMTYIVQPSRAPSAVVVGSKGGRGKKKINGAEEDSPPDARVRPLIDTRKALAILSEISAITLDSVAEQPLYEGEADVQTSSMLALIPPLAGILEQVGGQDDLLAVMPELSDTDLHYVAVSNHLLQVGEEANNSSKSASAAAAAKAKKSALDATGDDTVRDAMDVTLALWHQNADLKRRDSVATHVQRLMAAKRSTEQGNAAASGYEAIESKVKSESYFYSSRDDYSWRGNYCLENIIGNVRHLLCDRVLNELFEALLLVLLKSLEDTTPAIRAKVLKLLAGLMQFDADLILRETIRDAITLRLEDKAISVREEAVKLIGSYIVRGYPNLSPEYLEGLKVRLSADDGISVRKSVVNIFRDILVNQPSHPQYSVLCLLLLKQASTAKEEESIKDIIQSTFQSIWFLPPSLQAVNNNAKLSSASLNLVAVVSATDLEFTDVRSEGAGTPSRKRSSENLYGSDAFQTPTRSRLQLLPAGWVQLPKVRAASTAEESDEIIHSRGDVDSHYFVDPSGRRYDSFEEAAVACGIDPTATETAGRSEMTVRSAAPPSTVITSPRKKLKAGAALSLHVDSTAAQLVDIISIDDSIATKSSGVHQWIITLLRDVLHSKSNGDEGSAQVRQRRLASHQHVERIVASLVELLLRAEENDADLAKQLANRGKERQAYVMDIIIAISLLCEAHPPLISKHLTTLLPYLKPDPNYSPQQNALICLKVSNILSSTAMLEKSALRSMDMSEVLTDLVNIALSRGAENVTVAVQCIALLVANVTLDALPLFQLADKCFKKVLIVARSFPDPDKVSAAHAGMLVRCVIVLGFVCEHLKKCGSVFQTFCADFSTTHIHTSSYSSEAVMQMNTLCNNNFPDEVLAKSCTLGDIPFLHPGAIYGSVYLVVMYALSVNSESLQVQAAQALCGVFIGYPRLMVVCQNHGLLAALLGGTAVTAPKFSEAVYMRFVIALRDMMVAEETRLEQQAAVNLMKEAGMLVSSSNATIGQKVLGPLEQESDSSMGGFLLQQHLPMIVGFMSHPNDQLRHSTLQLIGTLLRQGMLCALDVMAQLVAFLGDPAHEIRSESLKIIQTEDKRHPTFLENRLLAGIESTVQFQNLTTGESSATMNVTRHTDAELRALCNASNRTFVSIYAYLYLSCIQGNKKRKIELVNGLLRRSNSIFEEVHELFGQHADSFEAHFAAAAAAASAARAAAQQQLQLEQAVLKRTNSDGSISVEVGTLSLDNSAAALISPRGGKKNALVRSNSLNSKAATDSVTCYIASVEESLHRLRVVDFLNRTVASLPFDSLLEPLGAIYWINRNTVLSTASAIEKLKQYILAIGGELRDANAMHPPALGSRPSPAVSNKKSDGHIEADLLLNEKTFRAWLTSGEDSVAVRLLEVVQMAIEVRSKEAALRLKSYLKVAYSISDDRCSTFNPDDKSASAVLSGGNDRVVVLQACGDFTPAHHNAADYFDLFSSENVALVVAATKGGMGKSTTEAVEAAVNVLRQVIIDLNRISTLLYTEPNDFTLVTTAATSGKRKRKATGASVEGSTTDETGSVIPARGKAAAKKSKSTPSSAGRGKKKRGKYDSESSGEELDLPSDEDEPGSVGSVSSGSRGQTTTPKPPQKRTPKAALSGVSNRAKRVAATKKVISYVDEEGGNEEEEEYF